MPLDRVSVVLHSLHKLTLLDVHSFHSETALFFLKLVIHDFLKAHALKTEQADEAVIVALVCQDVIRIQTTVIQIELMEDHVTRRSHL